MKLYKIKQDEFAPIVLKISKDFKDGDYQSYMNWLFILGLKPDKYVSIQKSRTNAIYKKQRIIDAYENKYLKFFQVKRTSRRYKIATKIYKMLKESL